MQNLHIYVCIHLHAHTFIFKYAKKLDLNVAIWKFLH